MFRKKTITVTITNDRELAEAKQRLEASNNPDERHVLETAIAFYEGR